MVIATELDSACNVRVAAQMLPDVDRGERGALPAMTPLHSHCLDIDLHRLDLRFAGSRLMEPHAVERLAESIERCGQIVPCIVVAIPGGEGDGAEALVLIDGYRRVAALRRLGRDTAGVEQWSCDLTQALLGARAGSSVRQHRAGPAAACVDGRPGPVAARGGAAVRPRLSWVSRRLQLLSGLPDAALAAVRGGRLSSWAANRVVVPLARASAEHAEHLLAALAGTPLTTRELRC
jgi:ParB family chromosome partitioning protein